MPTFESKSVMPVSAQHLFAWHSRPGAFERLAPPWEHIRIVEKQGGIEDGARLVMVIAKGPVQLRWEALHRDYIDGQQFRDEQVRGPFSRWIHTHRFVDGGGQQSTLDDSVEYQLPFGWPAQFIAGGTTHRMIKRMFEHRHNRTRNDLARHAKFADRPKQRIAITGASGLIGSQLAAFLRTGGHRVDPMVRNPETAQGTDIVWNPQSGNVDLQALEGVDAVVHLAGENIAGGRWTEERKRRVLESRVNGTKTIAEAVSSLKNKPKVLIVASAIGFYGARGDEVLSEESAPGEGYLTEVCRAWEEAARSAEEAGIRVVKLRIGIVLSAGGGALATMLPAFKLGVGGVVGSGRQYMSWIALDDVVGLVHHVLMSDDLHGVLNATAPNPVTNRAFTKTLGRVIRRPTVLPVPSFAIKAMFGEMGDTLLLQGSRVLPERAERAGFEFLHPELEGALRAELGLASEG
jgi:uncharacterized protein